MSKILLMTIDFPPKRGGVARYLDGLAQFFHARVRVIASPMQGSRVVDERATYRIDRERLLARYLWPRWLRAVWVLWRERRTYDVVVVSHVLPLGTAARVARWFTGKPYLVIVHGMDVGLAKRSVMKRRLARYVLRHARVVVTNSDALATEVKRDFHVEKTVTVYPSVSSIASDRVKKHPGDSFVVLSVARLVKRKGIDRVLAALSRMDDGVLKRLRYRIIGDGPQWQPIHDQIRERGLTAVVDMDRHVDDKTLWRRYAEADVFVLPTHRDPVDREGFGMVYIEAAMFAAPSIATDQPGVDEAVLDRTTGLLVPDGDIEALKNALLTLIDDADTRNALGKQAKERAETVFTPARQFAKLKPYLGI